MAYQGMRATASQIKDQKHQAPCRVDESAAAKIESLGDELKRDGIEVGEQAVLLSCLELLQDCQSCSWSDWIGTTCLPPCHEL